MPSGGDRGGSSWVQCTCLLLARLGWSGRGCHGQWRANLSCGEMGLPSLFKRRDITHYIILDKELIPVFLASLASMKAKFSGLW